MLPIFIHVTLGLEGHYASLSKLCEEESKRIVHYVTKSSTMCNFKAHFNIYYCIIVDIII